MNLIDLVKYIPGDSEYIYISNLYIIQLNVCPKIYLGTRSIDAIILRYLQNIQRYMHIYFEYCKVYYDFPSLSVATYATVDI